MTQSTNAPVAAPKARVTGPNGEFRHDQNSAVNQLRKRGQPLILADEGKQVKAEIQGTPQFIAAGTEQSNGRVNQFDRMIYNLMLTDGIKLAKRDTKKIFTDAVKAESAGDVEKAHELYNAWLNASQLTFSVIDNATTKRFAKGDVVKVFIGTAPSSINPSEVVLIAERPSLVEAETRAKVTYNVDDFILAD